MIDKATKDFVTDANPEDRILIDRAIFSPDPGIQKTFHTVYFHFGQRSQPRFPLALERFLYSGYKFLKKKS